MADYEALMRLALTEARRGCGHTSPNPMVGCVIAKAGRVIATGYHTKAGCPHAEREALDRAGERARGADVYVSLEPCDHVGRTGPCSRALIAAGVRRVFVGARDTNPIVDGRGIRRLRRAGIEVVTDVCGDEARLLNEAFLHTMSTGRPFVVAKLAQSLDGRVATRTGASQWITGEPARREGHRLRAELDAIAVGIGTVLADDPRLTCRVRGGRDPLRLVLDRRGRTPPDAAVVAAAKRSTAPTLILVGPGAPAKRCHALREAGAEVVTCQAGPTGVDLRAALTVVRDRGCNSVLVEGGPRLLGAFRDGGLIDKVHAFIAPLIVGGDGARSAVGGLGAGDLADGLFLRDVTWSAVGADLHLSGYPTLRRS